MYYLSYRSAYLCGDAEKKTPELQMSVFFSLQITLTSNYIILHAYCGYRIQHARGVDSMCVCVCVHVTGRRENGIDFKCWFCKAFGHNIISYLIMTITAQTYSDFNNFNGIIYSL